jgi:hypothetical protein
MLVVRSGRVERRQIIASCDEASRGNALASTGGAVIDVAACDGLFRLLHRPSKLVVERESADGLVAEAVSIALPPGVREVRQPRE